MEPEQTTDAQRKIDLAETRLENAIKRRDDLIEAQEVLTDDQLLLTYMAGVEPATYLKQLRKIERRNS